MKLEIPLRKWFIKTGKSIARKPGKAKINSQKTEKVSFQSKEESSDDSDDSDDSEDDYSDDSDEQSNKQVGWSWHQDSKIIISEEEKSTVSDYENVDGGFYSDSSDDSLPSLMVGRYVDSSDSDDDSVYSFEPSSGEYKRFPCQNHDNEFPSFPEDAFIQFPSVAEDAVSHQEECFTQPKRSAKEKTNNDVL